ncbi:hypothetical protein GCM10010994_42360 [Chelatococcus reniformis]|uniref:Uncharacterized protein n=1 Tax=Chelatococcus reniformis TaxID=1494448 RepID=A0A916XLE0_9HYPH|nr:hypothetical protein GCM10010994_42360 [Chelatococcus reniformis]
MGVAPGGAGAGAESPVKRDGGQIVSGHPKPDRHMTGFGQGAGHSRHEPTADAAILEALQHIDGIDLAGGGQQLLARAAARSESDHPPVRLRDENRDGGIDDRLRPVASAGRHGQAVDRLVGKDAAIRLSPGSHMHFGDRLHVRFKGPSDGHLHGGFLSPSPENMARQGGDKRAVPTTKCGKTEIALAIPVISRETPPGAMCASAH